MNWKETLIELKIEILKGIDIVKEWCDPARVGSFRTLLILAFIHLLNFLLKKKKENMQCSEILTKFEF